MTMYLYYKFANDARTFESLSGQNESTSSFAWFPDQPKKIVIGMHRDLKIFDLRGMFHMCAITQTYRKC